MSQDAPFRCFYSAAGHAKHPIQFKLAFNASPPRVMTIVGEHPKGVVVAPATGDASAPEAVEVWYMHEPWRVVVKRALAKGHTRLLSYEHALAQIGGEYISHTTEEGWRECPTPEDLAPWERPYFTRAQVDD
jgi:hypothetical protein